MQEECGGNPFDGGISNALSPAPPKSKPPTGNLFTSKGLEPSMSDLDHMFDDDNSGDETVSPGHLSVLCLRTMRTNEIYSKRIL